MAKQQIAMTKSTNRRTTVSQIATAVPILLVRVYQYSLGLVFPPSCRFVPSCSEYTIEALRSHGLFRGLWLGAQRISRCHPWGGFGYDPVPDHEHTTAGLIDR